jgi:hypothetical protein
MALFVAVLAFALVLFGCDLLASLFGNNAQETAETSAVPGYLVDMSEPASPAVLVPSIDGYYLIELWGGQGWNPSAEIDPANQYGGKGAYVRGGLQITPEDVDAGTALTVSVGVGGSDLELEGYGGGASDVRWNGDSLNDRIIVAAGGGGSHDAQRTNMTAYASRYSQGGYGGAFQGGESTNCAAIVSDSSTAPRTDDEPIAKATHYSGKVFVSSVTIDGETYTTVTTAGNATMPAPSDGTETGHSGSSYARITLGRLGGNGGMDG